MAATTKFIDKTDFASYQDISGYIANAYVDRMILSAQETQIRPILGDVAYSALQTAVAASTTDSDDDALIAKITPVLVYRSMMEYIGASGIYFTNMGGRVLSDEQSREATPEELRRIAERCRVMAEIYTRELWEFLDDNKTTYATREADTQRWQKQKRSVSGLSVVRARDNNDRGTRLYDLDF